MGIRRPTGQAGYDQLVHSHIGSAYDKVRIVAENLDALLKLSEQIVLEAPVDGTAYMRKDADWVAYTGSLAGGAAGGSGATAYNTSFTAGGAGSGGGSFIGTGGGGKIVATLPADSTVGDTYELVVAPDLAEGIEIDPNGNELYDENGLIESGKTVTVPTNGWLKLVTTGTNQYTITDRTNNLQVARNWLWEKLVDGPNGDVASKHYHGDMSDDGQVILLSDSVDYTYLTTDGGVNWQLFADTDLNTGSTYGSSRAAQVSADGNRLFVMADKDECAYSSDRGVTWVNLPKGLNSGNSDSYGNADMSRNGLHAVAGFDGGYASVSHDGCATWSPLTRGLGSSDLTANNMCCAISEDGQTIAVGRYNFGSKACELRLSTDGGSTFSDQTGKFTGIPADVQVGCVAMSGNGQTIVVTVYNYNLGNQQNAAFISRNRGTTWDALPEYMGINPPHSNLHAESVSVSPNGQLILAAWSQGYASISEDGGRTWIEQPKDLNTGVSDDAISAVILDNYKCLVTLDDGYVAVVR